MAPIGKIAGALRRSERGYTLIELLVAATMGMVVLGGAVTIFIGAVRSEPRTSSKVTAITHGRVAVERITRELRQGVDVIAESPSQLGLVTYLPQGSCVIPGAGGVEPCRVSYVCSAGVCMRTVSQPNGSSPGPAVQVVEDLSSNAVFSYVSSEPGSEPYVSVRLSFTTNESGPVVVADGASLRNGGV